MWNRLLVTPINAVVSFRFVTLSYNQEKKVILSIFVNILYGTLDRTLIGFESCRYCQTHKDLLPHIYGSIGTQKRSFATHRKIYWHTQKDLLART